MILNLIIFGKIEDNLFFRILNKKLLKFDIKNKIKLKKIILKI